MALTYPTCMSTSHSFEQDVSDTENRLQAMHGVLARAILQDAQAV